MAGRELAGAGAALFSVVRFWSRRWALRAAGEPTAEERRVRAIMVLEAVDTAARTSEDVSVSDVAHQLGIDQSGASRFIAAAVDDGYLRRSASAVDRRRVDLTLTPKGRRLLADARAWQEEVFAQMVAGWDPVDAAQFAGHIRRLADQLASDAERQ
ncbi:DNA-binding transcriptional regulator, MarR family [Streptoalloteichus tenebrarius]|uniref:DNA-binding transcriptional regulator, MarR family n=1 Tax=Streptoalloteichus tenebrarius (strain ATCC 17920 / DSM 40477 / JCM 4838 / CBS 697.72 / NBRC 16177 / NCIMB 11028 / NRRL B-12390 / A12253. 1 / ISP 5477) TaxID=1933 RepID=A0ABT1HNR3_STRSD|nr:MarR family transcriptional regulator [Streptoalloteichus tenebrarius]MCP2257141.1 DNA-binding transcriptional regulator, MarR family [Streptoalloteichus tenebrarius]BFE98774.1 MarR family winged helix-turn-helix transcriptional regulator [Streptoalloteichus tenebrarius]